MQQNMLRINSNLCIISLFWVKPALNVLLIFVKSFANSLHFPLLPLHISLIYHPFCEHLSCPISLPLRNFNLSLRWVQLSFTPIILTQTTVWTLLLCYKRSPNLTLIAQHHKSTSKPYSSYPSRYVVIYLSIFCINDPR